MQTQGQIVENQVKPLTKIQLDLEIEAPELVQKTNFKALHFQQRQLDSKRTALEENTIIDQETNGILKDKLETSASTTGRIKTSDGIGLWFRRYENKNSKANIVILHSFNEHVGFYEHVARRLFSSEYTVITFDQRGTGQSDGTRGHLKSIERYILGFDDFNFLNSKILMLLSTRCKRNY